MTASALASLLHARKIGKDKWVARCPSHPDRHPSLQIARGREGVLLRCMSHGCDTRDVLKALGLEWSDLFYSTRTMTPEIAKRVADERLLDYWIDRRKMAVSEFAATRPKVPHSLWGDAKDPDEFIQSGGDYAEVLACLGDWWSAKDVPGYADMTKRIEFMRAKLDPEKARQDLRSQQWNVMNRTQRERHLEAVWDFLRTSTN